MQRLNKPLEDTWLYKYREGIRTGRIRAGRDMITELDHLLEDLSDPEYIYDTSAADLRIRFIEGCVRMTKAPFYGKPMRLILWEKALIEAAYSFKIMSPDTGEWVDRFQEILLLIARKNGKTELIAALQLAEMVLGKPGTDIICSGQDDGTSDIAYQAIDTMRSLIDPKSRDTWRNLKGLTCKANGNHVYKLSDSTRQKEGRNIDMAGLDEIWSLKDKDGGIYKSITQSTSTKDAFKIFLFGSEGFVDGFLVEKRAEYMRIIYREDESLAAKRKLPWLYTQDDEREVWDTDENDINPAWEKSNPSIGVVKKWDYMRTRVDEARRSKSDRVWTLSKDFNFKSSNSEAWLAGEKMELCRVCNLDDLRGSIALGAVDLAETTDMCSAKALLQRPGDKVKYILSMYWIPERKLEVAEDKEAGARYREWARDGLIRIVEGNDVDVSVVADWFAELYKQQNIRLFRCGYDQRFAKQFIKRMDDYGFDTEMILQNRYVLSTPMRIVEADLRDELITGLNEIDEWCLMNTAVQVWDTGHIMPVKIKGQAARRIDGSLSLIMSYEMLRRYRAEYLEAIGA